jgi:hypothetical protein
MRTTKYEYVKDGFLKGEYSIYKRTYVDGKLCTESYCFGVTRKYDADKVTNYLNGMLRGYN